MSTRMVPYAPRDVVGGKYRVVRLIGAGGVAAVFEAEDITVGRRVALKVIHPDVAARGHFTQRQMEEEGRLLVGIAESTDHVVEVLTAGVTDDRFELPYYVMELLDGYTLRFALERKRAERRLLSVFDATGIALDIAVALMHAHRRGVVHGDVKPSSAFIARQIDGSVIVKLLDFGIGAGSSRASFDTGLKGTYRYAAPEQLRREALLPAADIYAAGLVMYELLTLRTPFETPDAPLRSDMLVQAHLEVEAPPVSRFRADVDPDLEALIAECLRKDPKARPPSGFVLTSRLEALRDRLDPSKTRSHVDAISDVGLEPFVPDTLPDAPPFSPSFSPPLFSPPPFDTPLLPPPPSSRPRDARIDSNAPVVRSASRDERIPHGDGVLRQSRRDSALVAGLGIFTALLLSVTGWLIVQPLQSEPRAAASAPAPSVSPVLDAGLADH